MVLRISYVWSMPEIEIILATLRGLDAEWDTRSLVIYQLGQRTPAKHPRSALYERTQPRRSRPRPTPFDVLRAWSTELVDALSCGYYHPSIQGYVRTQYNVECCRLLDP
jgi:hypothetical protein